MEGMDDPKWRIEGEFRDGTARVRDRDGRFKSLSNAILEETSEVASFDEQELANRFDVAVSIIREHLTHLKEHHLVEGDDGNWRKPNDFATEFDEQTEYNQDPADDDSLGEDESLY